MMGPDRGFNIHDIRGVDHDDSRMRDPGLLKVDLEGAVISEAPVAIYTTDLAGTVLTWNKAAEKLFGWRADEVIGKLVPLVTEKEKDDLIEFFPGLLHGESTVGLELSPPHRDGHRLRVLVSVAPIKDETGEPVAATCIAVDLTDQHKMRKALSTAEQKWRTLLNKVSDTVTIIDTEGRIISSTKDFGYSFDGSNFHWSHMGSEINFTQQDQERALEMLNDIIENPGVPFTDTFEIALDDGRYQLLQLSAVNHVDDPQIGGIVITTRDVTEVRLAESLLADEASVLELTARGADVSEILARITALIEHHTKGTAAVVLLPNTASADYTVVGSEDLLEPLRPLVANGDVLICTQAIDTKQTIVVEDIAASPMFRGDPSAILEAGYLSAWSHPITATESGDVLGTIAIYYTEKRAPSEREQAVVSTAAHLTAIAVERARSHSNLAFQASHDHLTGLPNRIMVQAELEKALARSKTTHKAVAVLVIDLDRFKVINDSLGHGVGDSLLMHFGERLRSLVRPEDFVGHFGSDEYVVVLENIDDIDGIRGLTSRLDLAMREPFLVEGQNVFLSTSIGVALSTGPHETSQEMLQHADVAMSRAKTRGRDRIEIFDQQMRTEADEHLRIDRELRVAIERAELRLHYQPKIDLTHGKFMGVEALLRWEHPDRGLVLPGEFIGVAEETGLIVRIGTWVVEEAIRQARTWVDRFKMDEGMNVAVNISARQMSSPGLVTHISRVLQRHRWPAEWLTLEITESILIDDTEANLAILHQLKALGVHLSIDDFGTGFSSLSYLHRFPVDAVKVDKAFVSPLNDEGDSSPVATAVVHMARALSLKTAAEGIEEPTQLHGVRALGCDVAQGFLFAKALPSEELAEFIKDDLTW